VDASRTYYRDVNTGNIAYQVILSLPETKEHYPEVGTFINLHFLAHLNEKLHLNVYLPQISSSIQHNDL